MRNISCVDISRHQVFAWAESPLEALHAEKNSIQVWQTHTGTRSISQRPSKWNNGCTRLMQQSPAPMHAVDECKKVLIEQLAAHGHLNLIEGVLQHIVAVQVVHPACKNRTREGVGV